MDKTKSLSIICLYVAFLIFLPITSQAETIDNDGKVQTVLGPIEDSQLGVVLPHEHLLINVTDNSIFLDNPDLIVTKLKEFINHPLVDLDMLKKYPDRTVVELSSRGLRWENSSQKPEFLQQMSYPEALAEISKQSGVNVIMGSSYYKEAWHPSAVKGKSIEEIEKEIIKDITIGVDNTSIKAGIIGEVGIGGFSPAEQKVLIASALAQLKTGAVLNIHFDYNYDPIHKQIRMDVLDILKEIGVDTNRVVYSHLIDSEHNNTFYEKLAANNLNLEFDFFGVYFEEASSIEYLINKGYVNKILVSQDVSNNKLLSNEGYVYILNHLQAGTLPKIPREYIEQIMVDNPKKLLPIKIDKESSHVKLVGYWKGNKTFYDSSSNNNAIPNNGLGFAPGIKDRCFGFNGKNQYLNIPYFEDLSLSKPFSFSTWVRADSSQVGQRITILDKSHGYDEIIPGKLTVSNGWTLEIQSNGKLNFTAGTGTSWKTVKTSRSVRDNKWHHVVGVYTGDKLKIYLDGMLNETKDINVALVSNKRSLFLGSWRGTSRFLKGYIDEVRFYNGVLSDKDVLDLKPNYDDKKVVT